MRGALLVTTLLAVLPPCRLAGQDTTRIGRALTAQYAQFSKAYANRWPDTVAAVYAPDAIYLAPDQEVIRGRDSIRATFASFLLAQSGPGPVVTFEIVERRFTPNLVTELGYYHMGPAGSDPATLPRGGKFTVVWARQRDGAWLIQSDNYSGLRPSRQQATGNGPQGGMAIVPDSVLQKRDSLYRAALAAISGHENEPAGQVFKNIKVFTQMPASRLLIVMRDGFSPALGVDCTHCHVSGDFASEQNDRKQVARDMMAMTRRISDSLLTAVPHLRSERPTVTCTTCHRGQVKPATGGR
jgi:uncharacterized protein (TIGR02246 family)